MDDWFEPDPVDGAPPTADPTSALWTYDDGLLWDLGPAELDADGDWTAESVISDVDGEPVLVSDVDGDGRVDRLTRLDGSRVDLGSDQDDEHLEWRPTSLGRLQ